MIRIFQIKNADSLGKLVQGGAAADAPALQRLQALNPHVDLANLKAGSVLLVPDSAEFSAGDGDPVAGEAFDGFAGDATAGLKRSAEAVRAGIAQRDDARRQVQAAFKSAAVKRVLDADPVLRQQADSADARFKAEQKEGADALDALAAMNDALSAELAKLAKLFK